MTSTVIEGYTDENGIAKFTLRYGKYTYSEFDPLDGYVIRFLKQGKLRAVANPYKIRFVCRKILL